MQILRRVGDTGLACYNKWLATIEEAARSG